MNGAGAFGAAKAGIPFDPVSFIQRPLVICRLFCWLFAVVVFGCITSEGWYNEKCLYNQDANACNFGVGVGVIAFLASIALLIVEAMFDNFSSIKIRRRAVIINMAFSAFWAFMWFVCFCYLSDEWRKSDMHESGFGVNNLRAAIAFSFFSIFTWAGCAFFDFMRYRQGADSAFAPSYEVDPHAIPAGGGQYGGYPGGPDMNEAYQEAPFSGGNNQPSEKMPSAISNFQAPAY